MIADPAPFLPHEITDPRLGRLGATPLDDSTRFVVWAPTASSVAVSVDDPIGDVALERVGEYWVADIEGLGHGDRYGFRLDGDAPVPDPAAAWMPDGHTGRSAILDPSRFEWTDHEWRGRALEGTVLYELHVGTFTPEGTFDAAIAHLPRLAALGITTIEVMPVGQFPGERNWGYDGVFPYAAQHSYGGPEAFARFVDAVHGHGLAVILDVVYNHLGPEGNVLPRFGPYFTNHYETPWGEALNVAGPGSDGVRRYFLESAARWVLDLHLDGFRLDAVHAVEDLTANPFWEQVSVVTRAAGASARKQVITIAESADNDPRLVRAPDRGGIGHDAVWNDDLHHCVRVALTGYRGQYYVDYDGSAAELADIVEHRWKFRGQYSEFRGRHHGRPADDVAPHRFVTFSRNHDQIGNRPAGDRPAAEFGALGRRYSAAVVLLGPFTPMLFQGEEYGEEAPFPFFVDHREPAILRGTREGRRAEFSGADWTDEVPDPGAAATFRAAVLDPSIVERSPRHAALLHCYSELLAIRREVASVAAPEARQHVQRHGDVVIVRRRLDEVTSWLVMNVSGGPAVAPVEAPSDTELRFHTTAESWWPPGDRPDARVEWSGARIELPGRAVALLVAR